MSVREMQPRALFVHSSNEMYGADKVLLRILRALPENERKSSVVQLPDDLPSGDDRLRRELEALGVATFVSPLPVLRRRYLTPSGIWPLARRLWGSFLDFRRSRPEILYCTTSAMVLCMPLARMAGIKKVILHVQEIWSPREALILGLMAGSASRILCISGATLASLPNALKPRAELLVNAHEDSRNDLKPIDATIRPTRFVVASRWNSWKGHRTLLSAWDAEDCPGQLTILGGPPPLGAAVDVPGLVRSLRFPSTVTIVGEVTDIEPYIDEADFLVLPSDNPEPFGLVLLESFARGRAVIASRAGGVTDVVKDRYDGLLFEIGNSDNLREILQSVDKNQARELGQNARRSYEDNFSIDAYRARFLAFWQSLSGGGNGDRK